MVATAELRARIAAGKLAASRYAEDYPETTDTRFVRDWLADPEAVVAECNAALDAHRGEPMAVPIQLGFLFGGEE